MSQRDPGVYLEDVEHYAGLAISFTTALSLEQYLTDAKTRAAVERVLEVCGRLDLGKFAHASQWELRCRCLNAAANLLRASDLGMPAEGFEPPLQEFDHGRPQHRQGGVASAAQPRRPETKSHLGRRAHRPQRGGHCFQ
jgi:hypothetical protein